jgi:DNA polymerase III epsilon subunit-like protein
MGFYVRKSLRAGPFRVNLSRSGIGVSAGIPGFRVGSGPRGNYVRVGAAGIHYQATLGHRSRAGRTARAPASPSQGRVSSDVLMVDTTGAGAEALVPTGPGDLVEQLNVASARWLWWPGLALVVLALTAVSPFLLIVGVPAVIWLALWERARRTVPTFYEVSGPAADWFERATSEFSSLSSLAGAWRIQASGAVTGTYQYKVNSGASNLVRRATVAFVLTPPRTLTTNISVPSLVCGRDALLFLPDRVLVRSGRRWSDLTYAALTVTAQPSRFIESGRVPRDAERVDTTWQYVNVKGGPDRRFKNNRRLPVMLYGRLELTSSAGLRWVVDCSRVEAARWAASTLTGPPMSSPRPHPAEPAPAAPRTRRPVQPVRPTARARSAASPSTTSPIPTRTEFAAPGRRGELFAYANLVNAQAELICHTGPYAVIDVETTGFSPAAGDRIIEIAVARVDPSGRIEDEYATLLNPDRDTGPVFIHGISNNAVRDAPRFPEIVGDIVTRLEGCVIVAHNAAFEERFLAAEFARANFAIRQLPALCSLWLGQRTFYTPNHKLATLARHAGIAMPDAHAALGDVRAVAQLLPLMLARHGDALGYPAPPGVGPVTTPVPAGTTRPCTRAVELRRGTDGWMASILARLPMSAAEAGDADAERYLSALSSALEDGRIVGDEARALAQLAGAAGFGSSQVAALNQRFLESMRQAAFEDDILTTRELATLRTAARALGTPDYFDDLEINERPTPAMLGRHAAPEPNKPRRCGHCHNVGHYRSTCPELTGA